MGNFIGFRENNANKTNINIFEKRYGYNLNDLHSYIYKINLPLKPPYVEYVLEEKKKKGKEDPSQECTSGKEENVEAQIEANVVAQNDANVVAQNERNRVGEKREKPCDPHAPVDVYNKYERENINNSRNIYKNKLIIKDRGEIKKYEDRYVHMSVDMNYTYDTHKNNIYTEDNIGKYFSEKDQVLTDEKKAIKKKTYVNFCLNYYNNLDTCVTKKYQKNVQNRKDRKLMNEIKKVELNYYSSLSAISKSVYMNEFATNLGYHEYRISKLYDGVEKIKLNKELNELRERYNNILKYNEQGEKHSSTHTKQQRRMHSNKKKYLLLNI
ncbi:conserved Plasmodium protein, unknown function [Plasmodium ovale]|uniref:Uncharacterized protein n=1 Tax=Plasmodium ovale TaxID=36330 RepID=A0A1C3KQW6_PLAOA|nr:conserved Plasmodium protein, unknown function [Plasmodium ovale]